MGVLCSLASSPSRKLGVSVYAGLVGNPNHERYPMKPTHAPPGTVIAGISTTIANVELATNCCESIHIGTD